LRALTRAQRWDKPPSLTDELASDANRREVPPWRA
jgi:hypothetical protein